jgi:uncharacterized protein DUF4150
MPATVNVNSLTVVHASSSGIASSFPDVCKTPTPGGPIPIPYPNIAQSSDTADGSSTVKVDGNPIMLKSSNFATSTGDEAGSVMGVVSNKIKGKAIPVNASFDVKVDGTAVFRLSDPMQTNCGSPANAVNAAIMQPPLPPGTALNEFCERVKKKKEEQPGDSVASKNSGMHPRHFAKIKEVAAEKNVLFYFRQTAAECLEWISANHMPKPHRVFNGNTIKGKEKTDETQHWLDHAQARLLELDPAFVLPGIKVSLAAVPLASNKVYSSRAEAFVGVVGSPAGPDSAGNKTREPLKAIGIGPQLSGRSYSNRWITGDYDLFQILSNEEGCKEVDQKGRTFSQLRRMINKGCDWDAIQHGPQAQWVPTQEEKEHHNAPDVHFPNALKGALASRNPNAKVEFLDEQGNARRNPMNIVDQDVTVIAPSGTVYLKEKQDVLDALVCSDCDK